MKKYSKIIILSMVIIIFGLITLLFYRNKYIDNQPKKSKLVNHIEWRHCNEGLRL